jgi:phage-related holin
MWGVVFTACVFFSFFSFLFGPGGLNVLALVCVAVLKLQHDIVDAGCWGI